MSSFVRNLLLGLLSYLLLACSLCSTVCAQARGGAIASGLASGISAGTDAYGPQTSVEGQLRQMSRQAGVIFAGEVLAVRPQATPSGGSGWVEVEFRIDQAVRGCVGQATYVLREWAGLWAGGRQRYTVGERMLMLLHTPSASGLSSPVGGQVGAIPLSGAGAAPGPQDSFAAAVDQAVDLRWLETRLLRTAATDSGSPGSNGTGSGGARGRLRSASQLETVYRGRAPVVTRKVVRSGTVGGASAQGYGPRVARRAPAAIESTAAVPLVGTVSQGITLGSVLSLMRGWEAEQAHAAQ